MRLRLLLVSLLLTICLAGCSSPFKLIVHNETRGSIEVEVKWTEDDRSQTQEWSLQPGEEKQKLVWFGHAPESFDVRVEGVETRAKTFNRAEYPKEMLQGGSLGPTNHLHITESNWSLSGPTFQDKFDESLPFIALSGCGLVPVLIAVWFALKPKRSLSR